MAISLADDAPMDLAGVEPAFLDAVHDAQYVFRQTLEAISYPGRLVDISPDGFRPPAQLGHASAAVLLTLCDVETSLWLDQKRRFDRIVCDYLRFHTNLVWADSSDRADFALAASDQLPDFDSFALGTDLDPQHSTTLIIEVDAFGSGQALRLRGPGIREQVSLRIDGPSEAFWRQRREQQACFPRGLDLLLCADHALMAIPRSTQLELY